MTRWTLPEVSPLCQNFRRDRLQNHVSPLSTVLFRDSAFMYATISTSPLCQSWITAGIRPFSSNLRVSGMRIDMVFFYHNRSEKSSGVKTEKPVLASRTGSLIFLVEEEFSRLNEQGYLGVRGDVHERCRAAELDAIDDVLLLDAEDVHGHLAGDELDTALFLQAPGAARWWPHRVS